MLVKPLLGMFHGEPRAKKWRAAVRRAGGALGSAAGAAGVLGMSFCVRQAHALSSPALPCPLASPCLTAALPAPPPQVDAALKTAGTVSEVLDATFPVLKPESLDAPPRPLGSLPDRLQHYAPELPPTPEWAMADDGAAADGSGSEGGGEQQQEAEGQQSREAALAAA